MKKTVLWIITICLVISLMPISAFAVTEHTHSWSSTWTANDTHHWHACANDNCTITSESECSGYGAHDFSQYPYRCTVCEFSTYHEHYGGNATCQYNAICEGCGTTYGNTNPNNHQSPEGYGEKIDAASHMIKCWCGHIFVASEPHNFTSWSKNSDGTEERWCEDCLYAETRNAQHVHSYSKATCVAPSTCSCGNTTGKKDPSNHTGGTEIKNAVSATVDKEGYTGDTYCKGCGEKIADGKPIQKLNGVTVKIDENAGVENVTFHPAEGIDVPTDASVVVTNQKIGLDPILSILEPERNISANHFGSSALADAIYTHTNGTEYRSGEIVLIDGEKYCIGKYDGEGSVLPMIRMSDGVMRDFDMSTSQFKEKDGFRTNLKQTDDAYIRIDGVLYHTPVSYTNEDGTHMMVLYHEGKPAGMINEGLIELYDDLTPTNAPVVGSRYLGSVTPDITLDGFDLTPGKKYDVYLIGANDITLRSGNGEALFTDNDGKREKIGTVSQTFDLVTLGLSGLPFDDTDEIQYIALHLPNDDYANLKVEDLDFGEVVLSEDKSQLYTTFSTYHFSPFAVYAVREAQEPEIKVITTDSSSISDVGGADDTDVKVDSNDLTWLWISIAVVLLVGASIIFVVMKKKKSED